MASKGQKFKKVSSELKLKILKDYDDNVGGAKTLARMYGVSYHTINTWLSKRKEGIDITINHCKGNSGRKKSKDLTMEDYKERYEIIKKYQAFLEARQEKK